MDIILSYEPFLLAMPAFVFCDIILRYSLPKVKLHTFHFGMLGIFCLMTIVGFYHWHLVFTDLTYFLDQTHLEAAVSLINEGNSDTNAIFDRLQGTAILAYYVYLLFTLRIFPYLSKLLVIFSNIITKVLPFIVLQIALLYVFTIVFCFSFS